MAISLTHAKVSAIADIGDASLVEPSDWNAEHTITMATARVLGRTTAGTGVVQELTTTGTGNVVFSAAPTFTGAALFATIRTGGAGAVAGSDIVTNGSITVGNQLLANSITVNGFKASPFGTYTFPATASLTNVFAGWANILSDSGASTNPQIDYTANAYYNGGFKYSVDGFAHEILMTGGVTTIRSTASGLAAAAITWASVAAFNQSGTAATNSTSGALVVTGGASASGAFYAGGLIDSGAAINAATTFKVAGTQVLAARITGYAAMTGTPNKAATYDTSTVTLAQLAGRVMQMQADWTTHGGIGA